MPAPSPYYPPPQPAPPYPPPQAQGPAPQSPLSPQGESVLANSLKESVAAQSKVVDKLFDELKELARKVDEKRQAPAPPVIMTMPQPEARPPFPPMMMGFPPAQPPMEGFPRYAVPDAGFEEERRPAHPRGEVELEEVPEVIEQDDLQTEVQEIPGPRGGQPKSEAPPPSTPKPPKKDAKSAAPAPRHEETAPKERPGGGAEQATDKTPPARPGKAEEPSKKPSPAPPQKAAAPGKEKARKKEKPPAAQKEEAPAPAPPQESPTPESDGPAEAPGAPPKTSEPKEPSRTSDDVRKELRDYLNGVRDKLDKGKGTSTGASDLLDYLGKLSDYLPENEKKRFRGSNERLAMESLKAQLAGKKGLRKRVAESVRPVVPRGKRQMTPSLVVDTFSYLKDLTAWHPDKAVASAMKDRIESIVAQLGRSR